MGAFNNPAAGLVLGVSTFLVPFLSARLHVESIVMNPAGGQSGEADVGGIGAERLDLRVAGIRPGTDDSPQGGA